MRERNIIWDIALVGLLFLLVVTNGLTLLQNQSIEKRLIGSIDALNASRGNWTPPETNTAHTTGETHAAVEHSPSYFDGSTNPKALRGDEKADDGDTLILNESSEPNSLNVLIDNDATGRDLFELGTDYLAKRIFGDPNNWQPQLAQSWEKAMICRGIVSKKNAKELADKLNAALSKDVREKLKISKIEAESDEILRVELFDAVGDYREPVMKVLGDGTIEAQHWVSVTFEGEKFSDGTKITANSVAERLRAAIQVAPGFKGRFLSNWERDGSVVILMTGDGTAATKAVQAYLETDANKGEVSDPKSVSGKSIKKVLTYDGTEHYVFEEKPVYTFYMRKGVKWHDGHPFTGKDIVFSYDAMMNPKVECPQARQSYQDCESCKLLNGDPFVVQFVWKKPFFLAFASSCEIDTFPEHIFHFADGDEFNKNPANQGLMGTGPYKLENRNPKTDLVYVRNDDYWGKKAHFKRIKCIFVPDPTVSMQLLKKGDLDVHAMRKRQAFDSVNDPAFKSRFGIEISTANVYRYIGWNIRRDKFSSVKTRQALTMLIDRQRIVDKIYYGYAQLLDVPAHPESPTYPKDADSFRLPFDVAAAKKLLKEDGWASTESDPILHKDFNGKSVAFTFNLLIQTSAVEYEAVANQIKESFAQAGIDVNIQNLEWSVFLQNVERLNYDAMILGWRLTPADDPYQLWHSSQTVEKASNHCGYVNKQVDQWIEEGRKELDTEKRNAIFQNVYRQVARDQPYTFLFVEKRTVAYDNRIQNAVYNFQNKDVTRWWVPREKQKVK